MSKSLDNYEQERRAWDRIVQRTRALRARLSDIDVHELNARWSLRERAGLRTRLADVLGSAPSEIESSVRAIPPSSWGQSKRATVAFEACRVVLGLSNLARCPVCSGLFLLNTGATLGCTQSCAARVFNNAESTKKRKRDSCLLRLGVDNPSKAPEVRAKKIATCRATFGVDFPQESPQVRSTTKKNNLKAWGCWPTQHPRVRESIMRTCRSRYSRDNVMQDPEVFERNSMSRLSRKPTLLADGCILNLQGFEPALALSLDRAGLIVEVPSHSIRYLNPLSGRSSWYHPDLFAVNPRSGRNYLIEVKSTYTLTIDLEVNLAKFKAAHTFCKPLGVDFVLCVLLSNGEVFRLFNPTSARVRKLIANWEVTA